VRLCICKDCNKEFECYREDNTSPSWPCDLCLNLCVKCWINLLSFTRSLRSLLYNDLLFRTAKGVYEIDKSLFIKYLDESCPHESLSEIIAEDL